MRAELVHREPEGENEGQRRAPNNESGRAPGRAGSVGLLTDRHERRRDGVRQDFRQPRRNLIEHLVNISPKRSAEEGLPELPNLPEELVRVEEVVTHREHLLTERGPEAAHHRLEFRLRRRAKGGVRRRLRRRAGSTGGEPLEPLLRVGRR